MQVVFVTLHFTFQTTLTLIPKYVAHTYISFLEYCFIVFRDPKVYTDHDFLQTIPNCSFLQQLLITFMFTCRISGHIQVDRWLWRNKALELTLGLSNKSAFSRIGIVN